MNALCSLDGSIPEGGYGPALKYAYQGDTEPLAKNDCGADVNSEAEAWGRRKESIIEEE